MKPEPEPRARARTLEQIKNGPAPQHCRYPDQNALNPQNVFYTRDPSPSILFNLN